MIDQAIGYGQLLIECVMPDDDRVAQFKIDACGTIPSEQYVIDRAAQVLRDNGLNPEGVRIVWSSGTWQETPTWTQQWYKVE
jgi:hypothetical protein